MKEIRFVSGKRKTSVAKVKVTPGQGVVLYKGLPHDHLRILHKLALSEPIEIAKQVLGKVNHNFYVTVVGGGRESQIQAARLGIAKALVASTGSVELKKAFLTYDRNMLVADTRRKETRKPGDSKARARRQTSYR